MRKHSATASRSVWLILVLILLSLGGTHCANVSFQSDEAQTVTHTIEVDVVGGWANLDRQVRDAQVLESLVLLDNSAPSWGRGPEDGDPFIAAFDPHTQKIIWELRYASAAPVVANSHNLFIVEEFQLVAIDLNNGDETWSVPFAAPGLSQVFSDDDIVLAANDEALFAFSATNGELRWESDLPIPLDPSVPLATNFTSWREHSALAKHGHTVYARRLDYHDTDECQFSLFALDANSGNEQWRFPIHQSNRGECLPGTLPLAFGDGLALAGTWDGLSQNCALNALNEHSGEVVWSRQITEGCSTSTRSFYLDGKFILVSARNILALEGRSGRLLWQQERPFGAPNQLIASRGWVVCSSGGTSEKTLSLIDLHSGRVLDQLEVSLPQTCNFTSSVAGLSNDRAVLVVGNCIRSFSIGRDGDLQS